MAELPLLSEGKEEAGDTTKLGRGTGERKAVASGN